MSAKKSELINEQSFFFLFFFDNFLRRFHFIVFTCIGTSLVTCKECAVFFQVKKKTMKVIRFVKNVTATFSIGFYHERSGIQRFTSI